MLAVAVIARFDPMDIGKPLKVTILLLSVEIYWTSLCIILKCCFDIKQGNQVSICKVFTNSARYIVSAI